MVSQQFLHEKSCLEALLWEGTVVAIAEVGDHGVGDSFI